MCQRLLTGLDITLMVLAVLQLCVGISFAVLGSRALVSRREEEVKYQLKLNHLTVVVGESLLAFGQQRSLVMEKDGKTVRPFHFFHILLI